MFLASRKFLPGFGISGTEVSGTPEEQKSQQKQGWEWSVHATLDGHCSRASSS